MRCSLRTLLIALALLPPILAPLGAWGWQRYQAHRQRQRWLEMTLPAQDRVAFIKSMLCPSHPPENK